MSSILDIERAIRELPPDEAAELYAWFDRNRESLMAAPQPMASGEGLGMFGSSEDAALLDEVVQLAYMERRRPSRRLSDL